MDEAKLKEDKAKEVVLNHLDAKQRLLISQDQRHEQVYAQEINLKRQKLHNAYMIDQAVDTCNIKTDAEAEEERREKE